MYSSKLESSERVKWFDEKKLSEFSLKFLINWRRLKLIFCFLRTIYHENNNFRRHFRFHHFRLRKSGYAIPVYFRLRDHFLWIKSDFHKLDIQLISIRKKMFKKFNLGYVRLGEEGFLNLHGVGRDSWIPLSSTNFLKKILQPLSSKMTPSSNSGLDLYYLVCTLHHR